MRLRLRVQRNELPPVSTIWPISDTQRKHTIAQLLDVVNQSFPLEAEQWGLEDYVVTVGGYECLHFHEVGVVCKDEDELVIRPLSFAETRARTMTGRRQITGDGRKLEDGVAFGRPALRAPVRPDVRIPPRKRRRVLDGSEAGEEEEARFVENGHTNGEIEEEDEDQELDLHRALMPIEDAAEHLRLHHGVYPPDGDDDPDDDDDEDFEVDETDAETPSERSSEDDALAEDTSSSEGESSSDDNSDTSDTSSDPSSDPSETSSEDDSSSEVSWNGISTPGAVPPKKHSASQRAPKLSAAATPASIPENHKSFKKRKEATDPSAGEPSSASTTKKTKVTVYSNGEPKTPVEPEPKIVGLPHNGTDTTKARNQRRRDVKKLQHLKEVQVLPADANLRTLHEWQAGNKQAAQVRSRANAGAMTTNEHLGTEPRGPADASTAAVEEVTSPETLDHAPMTEDPDYPMQTEPEVNVALADERQQLIDAIATGGVDVTPKSAIAKAKAVAGTLDRVEDQGPEEMSTKSITSRAGLNSAVLHNADNLALVGDGHSEAVNKGKHAAMRSVAKSTDIVPNAVSRRAKLDLAGSKRLLFGSLGVRVPKTQQDRDALQKKLAGEPRRAVPSDSSAKETETVELEAADVEGDPEDWRSKIELAAVECCDEGVTLSKPPFPFFQRWDHNYRGKKRNKSRNGSAYAAPARKRKRGKYADGVVDGTYAETYDKYNTDGNGDVLDYDGTGEDDEYWEEGALLDAEDDDLYVNDPATEQLLLEAAASAESDDFPVPPKDTNSLPTLASTDARKGDIITYTELVCSPATNWQPTMLTRTVQLQDKEGEDWVVKVAKRDLTPKTFDQEGNRLYSKFEMEGVSDDEGEDQERTKTMGWDELGEVRLLMRSDRQERH